jgi:hypothetical protein
MMGTIPDTNKERIESEHGGLEWHTGNHVIHAWVTGDWTDKSAEFFNREFLKMMESSTASRVSIIFDTANMRKVLVSPHASVKQLNYLSHDKAGKAILYGIPMPQRAIVGLLVNVLSGAFRGKVGIAKDESDAVRDVLSSTPPNLIYG